MTDPAYDFQKLSDVLQAMDRAWDEIAAQYDFRCNGCEDNCCQSLFFHHTHAEKAYLKHGFNLLPRAERAEILDKARDYCEITFDPETPPDAGATSKKTPCPLLLGGRCRLYRHRPMICRMHGLPHELHRLGFPVIKGPGCDAGRFDEKEYIPFDRTPFYRDMAGVEMEFRAAYGKTGKVRETIAQILLSDTV